MKQQLPTPLLGEYQKRPSEEPVHLSPQGNNEFPQSLPPPQDVSGNHMESLDIYILLVVTKHPSPTSWYGVRA